MCASQTRLFPRQWALCCKTARCGYSDDEIKNIDFNRPFQNDPTRTQIVDGHIRMAVLCVIQDSHFVVIEVNSVDKSIYQCLPVFEVIHIAFAELI